jgi:hypothetical protein
LPGRSGAGGRALAHVEEPAGMAQKKKPAGNNKRKIDSYAHPDKNRPNAAGI